LKKARDNESFVHKGGKLNDVVAVPVFLK